MALEISKSELSYGGYVVAGNRQWRRGFRTQIGFNRSHNFWGFLRGFRRDGKAVLLVVVLGRLDLRRGGAKVAGILRRRRVFRTEIGGVWVGVFQIGL